MESDYPSLPVFSGLRVFHDGNFFNLSEEIRSGVEQRKGEIHSQEDLERVVHELNLKK